MGSHLNGRIFLVAAVWLSVSIAFQDFDVLKMQLQQLSDVPMMASLKMFRAEGRKYKFNVTLKITSDDLSIYDVEAAVHRSVIGNNQFVYSPFRLPRIPLCDFINIDSAQWYQTIDDLANHSNLPRKHDSSVNYCDLLKNGNLHEVVNYAGNVSNLNKFIPTGTYKLLGSLIDRKTNSATLKVLVITKLY